MKVLAVYARLYAECFAKALAGIAKNAWTLLLPIGLLAAFFGSLMLVAPFGWLGGIAVGLVVDALGSCYLYFVGEVVANTRVTFGEFRKSVGAYFWSIMNLLFVWWIASWALDMVLEHNAQAEVIRSLWYLAAFVLLNAVPEVLYEKGTFGGLATIQRTMHFIHENWIEWFVPNILVGAGAWFLWTHLPLNPFGIVGFALVGGALLHVLMVFRGHLFELLDGTSHRQRMFRYRSGS